MNSFMFSLITVILSMNLKKKSFFIFLMFWLSISVSTIILSKNILPFLVMVPVYIPMLPNRVLKLTIITDVILILMPISVGILISILFTMVILPFYKYHQSQIQHRSTYVFIYCICLSA